jgi:hypothetical protein
VATQRYGIHGGAKMADVLLQQILELRFATQRCKASQTWRECFALPRTASAFPITNYQMRVIEIGIFLLHLSYYDIIFVKDACGL